MHARGMSLRKIQGLLLENYAVEVSPESIRSATDALKAEVGAWQSRALEPNYPVVANKPIWLALRNITADWGRAAIRAKHADHLPPIYLHAFRDFFRPFVSRPEPLQSTRVSLRPLHQLFHR